MNIPLLLIDLYIKLKKSKLQALCCPRVSICQANAAILLKSELLVALQC